MRVWPTHGPPRFKIARWTDNELVLFDEARRESWLIYPPRSRYDFLRRQTYDTTLVVYHPWALYSPEVEHAIRLQQGCGQHGMQCEAQEAIQAAMTLGSIRSADCAWSPDPQLKSCCCPCTVETESASFSCAAIWTEGRRHRRPIAIHINKGKRVLSSYQVAPL